METQAKAIILLSSSSSSSVLRPFAYFISPPNWCLCKHCVIFLFFLSLIETKNYIVCLILII